MSSACEMIFVLLFGEFRRAKRGSCVEIDYFYQLRCVLNNMIEMKVTTSTSIEKIYNSTVDM